VYYMARVLYPTSKWLAIIVAAFVTFQPMHTDIMSAVNNDALINAIGGMFFLVMAWIYQRGLSLVRILLLSLILALGMLTKTTAVVLLAALPLAVLFYIWRSGHLPLFLGILIITFAIVAVGLVLWQLEILQGWVDEVGVWTERYFRVNISGTLDRVQDPTQVKLPLQAAPIVFQSFWAIFGWRHILVDSGVYITIAVITFVALLGLLGLVIRGFMVGENRSSFKDPFPFLVYALSAVLMAWLIAIFRSLADQGMNVYLSHGRYVFIAMAPFALLFTLGLRTWVREPFQRIASFIYLACIILLDSFCFWGYIVPFYY
jgi:hypothetical protein